MKSTKEKHLHKDRRCIRCKKFFECDGHPEGVDMCLMYKAEREQDNGRSEVDQNRNGHLRR